MAETKIQHKSWSPLWPCKLWLARGRRLLLGRLNSEGEQRLVAAHLKKKSNSNISGVSFKTARLCEIQKKIVLIAYVVFTDLSNLHCKSHFPDVNFHVSISLGHGNHEFTLVLKKIVLTDSHQCSSLRPAKIYLIPFECIGGRDSEAEANSGRTDDSSWQMYAFISSQWLLGPQTTATRRAHHQQPVAEH